MTLTRLALSNLRRRPARTALTLVSVAVAVAVLFSLLMFNAGYRQALQGQMQRIGVHLIVVPIGCPYEAASLVLEGGRIESYLDESVVDRIRSVEGVQIAAPQLMHALVRPEEGRTDIYLGIDESTLELKNWWRLQGGQVPTGALLNDPKALLLGYDAALVEQRERVGEQLWVPEIDSAFTVSGILEATGSQDDGFFYIPLRTAQDRFELTAQLTAVQIRLTDPAMASEVADRLEIMLPGAEIIRMEELLGSMAALMASAEALILAIVIVVVAIGAVGVLNTMLMSVFERTREIGILRATGAGRGDIFALVWTEALVMALAGGVAGLLLAATGSPLIERLVSRLVPGAPAESLLRFEPQAALLCLLVVAGIALLAGLYPAYRAATGRTIEALGTE